MISPEIDERSPGGLFYEVAKKHKLATLRVSGGEQIRQYLKASELYFDSRAPGRSVSMAYPFPAISEACPVCGRACGAVFRGYYRRWVVCPEASFMGWLAIRTGYCKALRRRFALFPSFLVPFRGFSRAAMLLVWRAWKSDASKLQESVDGWMFGLGREVYLSLSTLYSQLQFLTRQAAAGRMLFAIPAFSPNALCGLASLGSQHVDAVILHSAFGVAANSRIDPPP